MVSFSSLGDRNATFLLALTIALPAAGLQSIWAARFRACRMPSPEFLMRSPFLRSLVMGPTTSSKRGFLRQAHVSGQLMPEFGEKGKENFTRQFGFLPDFQSLLSER
jgi:hypothetical protein